MKFVYLLIVIYVYEDTYFEEKYATSLGRFYLLSPYALSPRTYIKCSCWLSMKTLLYLCILTLIEYLYASSGG